MAAPKETGEVLPVSTAEVLAAMKNMGMNKARVESFSDGVFAFAITLLVLGFQVPDLKSVDDRQLRERLLQALQQLLPYVTSFATIGIIWLNHHAMFDEVESVDHPVLVLNLLLLFVISFIPFPTAVLSRYGALPSNTFLYGSVLTMLAMTFFAASFLHRQKGIPPKRNAQRQITLELAAKSGGTRYLPRGNGDFPPPSAGGCDDLLPFGRILPAA